MYLGWYITSFHQDCLQSVGATDEESSSLGRLQRKGLAEVGSSLASHASTQVSERALGNKRMPMRYNLCKTFAPP